MTATTLTPPPGLAELVARPNWVGWKKEARDGQLTKVPYQVKRGERGEDVKAKAGDPATWDTFAAVATACAAGRFDGPGYEFHVGEDTIGIDLDDVRDPATGALTPLARAIIALADTYTEPSPSGRGVHIIGRGALPRPELEEGRHGKKKGDYELYGGGRFFTMTLQPFPRYDEVRAIDPATMRRLFALMWPEDAAPKPARAAAPLPSTPVIADDAALLDRARTANDGGEFARLFAGELGSAPGASEADYRLAFRLAFWTGHDAPRIARLMEASGRRRDKWYTRRGTGTWLDYTITRACTNQPERYDPHRDPATHTSPAPTYAGVGDRSPRLAELERENTTLRRENAEQAVALERCGAAGTRKDARIAELEREVRALDLCISHPDQQVAGVAVDMAEAVQDAYAQGKVITSGGRDYARVVDKTSAKRRSVPTFGRGKKTIAAARPGDTIIREETIKTDRFEGKVPITYFHVPTEHRQRRGDTLLYLLPPPPEEKRHGGRKKIAVPAEVAAQDAPVRRETRRVEQFFSLADNRPLGEIKTPPHIDFWQADGTELTKAEADLFQDEIGARPPRQAPPRWQPKVQTSFQLDCINTLGTSNQVETSRVSVVDPFHLEMGRDGGTCPDCGEPVAVAGYCDRHFAAHRDEHRRRYAGEWGDQARAVGDGIPLLRRDEDLPQQGVRGVPQRTIGNTTGRG